MEEHKPGAAFLVSLGAITLVGPLAIHLFLPAMPSVKSDFGVSDAMVQLAFSITLITMAFVTPLYGSFSDRYGRRPVLLTGLVLFLVGSLVSALAGSIFVLIGGRFIQAVGAGCGLTLARAVARDVYGPAALVKAIAYLTMAYTLGPMVAPAVGGVLIDRFGWRAALWFALVAGAAISAAAYRVLRETRGPAARAGVRPAMLRNYGTLLHDSRFLAFVLQSGFMSFLFFAIAAASPFLMKNLLGRTATEYGLYFMCFPVGYCSGNLISSRLSGRVAVERMVLTGAVLCAIAVGVQAGLILGGHLSPLIIFVPGGMISFAQGLALPNAQAGAMRIKPDLAGTAAGLGVFVQMLLSAISAELYGVLANGTPFPMIMITSIGAVFAVGAAAYSFAHPGGDFEAAAGSRGEARRRPQ